MFLYFMLMEKKRRGQGDRFRGQLCVLGGIPAGVMCLKSITPIARISECECECVCVSPKDVITMVIQKPVDYVVEKFCLIYALPCLWCDKYSIYTHTDGKREKPNSAPSFFLTHAYCISLVADTVVSTVTSKQEGPRVCRGVNVFICVICVCPVIDCWPVQNVLIMPVNCMLG